MGAPTRIAQDWITRDRLLQALGGPHRLVRIRAPAGFGKTVLLAQFEERLEAAGQRVVRIELPPGPGPASAVHSLHAFADARREVGLRMLGDLLRDGDDVTLLIDDADRLNTAPDIRELLGALITQRSAPRIVMASRGILDMTLAREEANGNLLRITADAMLFDKDEQAAVLDRLDGVRMPAARGGAVLENLAGWPLGVGLQVRCALQGCPTAGTPDDPSDPTVKGTWRLIEDYFQQEVMASLSEELARFLVRASILPVVRVGDCPELFGANAGDLLRLASHQGALLWPVDPEQKAYVILPVFRQFLRPRLGEGEARELGGKACDLLARRGDYSGASMVALEIGDHARAAQMIERQMQTDFGLRDETRLLALAESVEPEVRDRHPRILLAQSQLLIFKFEFEQARKLLEQARGIVEEQARLDEAEPAEIRALEMLVLHREMVLALGQHDLPVAQDLGGRLLSGMEDMPPMQRVMLLASLIYAQQELYIFRGAERYYAQAKKLVPAMESWIWSVPLETFYARHLFQIGRTAAAIELLEATLAKLVEELGPRPMLGSITAIALAEVMFAIGAIDEAHELLKGYSDNIEHFGYLSLIVAARVTQARVHMARGEFDAGFAVLDRPVISAGELFDKLSRTLSIERHYWQLRLVREEAPRINHAAMGLSLTQPPEPHSSAGVAEESRASLWIQMARVGRRFGEAIALAQKWQRYTEGIGAVRSNVRWHVILACLRILAEEPRMAMRHLRRAVKLGTGAHYRAAFLAEIDLLREQLAILTVSDLDETEKAFVRSLIDVPKTHPTQDKAIELPMPVGAFSAREIAILRLVAKGQTNGEIGTTLGMTEGTVKWYLHKIYDMLGIRRRSQVAMLISQAHLKALDRGEPSPFDDDD